MVWIRSESNGFSIIPTKQILRVGILVDPDEAMGRYSGFSQCISCWMALTTLFLQRRYEEGGDLLGGPRARWERDLRLGRLRGLALWLVGSGMCFELGEPLSVHPVD